jgi:hypothetical protein
MEHCCNHAWSMHGAAQHACNRACMEQHTQMERDWMRQRGASEDGQRPPPFNHLGGTAGPVRTCRRV